MSAAIVRNSTIAKSTNSSKAIYFDCDKIFTTVSFSYKMLV